MTEELFDEYLREVVQKRPGAIFTPPSLLLMDQARSHKTAAAEKTRNMKSLLLPAGCTPLVQPLDVSLNKPFKGHMRNLWKQWLEIPESEQRLTKMGKRQRVSWKLRH